MATTPEGRVKNAIKRVLDRFDVEYDMAVPSGWGNASKGLDFTCVYNGRALYIEAKAPGEYPTPLQRQTLWRKVEAGAACFIISNEYGLQALHNFLYRATVKHL